MSTHEFLQLAVIYLTAALISVPIAQRLGLGSVLGYLLAGVAIGPGALGLIRSPETVLHLSEFGVVLLLFLIGLELNPRRLWTLRKPILGMGGLQILFCSLGLSVAGAFAGWDWRSSLLLAIGFSMSSTALAMQLLREKKLHQLPVGESSFAILLFQDLAVIPILALVPLLGAQNALDPTVSWASRLIPIGKGAAALITVVALGRYFVRPVFRWIVGTQLRELFTALALALVFGVAYLMDLAGLSMALGSFLAGLLLAESEFRHELEVDIEPFKGLLLGLFFIAVGMSMRLELATSRPFEVVAITLGLLLAKLAILFGVARLFRHTRGESALLAIALSQGGEFAFVLFGLARQTQVFSAEQADLANLAIALSMAATPFLFLLHDWLTRRYRSAAPAPDSEQAVRPEGNPVILAGFGRIGQVVGRILHGQSIGLTILEQDPGQIETVRKFGWKTFYGDVSRLDLLRAAGAAEAKLLILAIDDMDAVARTLEIVKEQFPHLRVLVRADSRIDAYHFFNAGVPVVRSTFAPGLEMGVEALKLLDVPAYEARLIGERFRRYDLKQFIRSARHVDDIDALITISAQSREELSRIMETDERKQAEISDNSWG